MLSSDCLVPRALGSGLVDDEDDDNDDDDGEDFSTASMRSFLFAIRWFEARSILWLVEEVFGLVA